MLFTQYSEMERSLVEDLAALKVKSISFPGEFLFLF
jgi:hypothetical protein